MYTITMSKTRFGSWTPPWIHHAGRPWWLGHGLGHLLDNPKTCSDPRLPMVCVCVCVCPSSSGVSAANVNRLMSNLYGVAQFIVWGVRMQNGKANRGGKPLGRSAYPFLLACRDDLWQRSSLLAEDAFGSFPRVLDASVLTILIALDDFPSTGIAWSWWGLWQPSSWFLHF